MFSGACSSYLAFCGALEFAHLGESALIYVVGDYSISRAQEKEGVATPATDGRRWSVKWISPADKTGGAP